MRKTTGIILISAFFSAVLAVEPPAGVTVLKDIEYVPGGGSLQSLDLYLPAESRTSSVPLVIFMHGGGWHSGSKDGCPAQFMSEHGYAVASINYRLLPDAVFPAQIEDCRAALRFLRTHAAKYGINPDKVAACGGSAGAHLASLMGTAAAADFSTVPAGVLDDASIRVQCVIDRYGPADFTLGGKVPSKLKLLGPCASDAEALAKGRWASPVTYVSRDTPPFRIEHGDADKSVALEQSQAMLAVLQAAGVEAALTVMPGAGHAGAAFFTKENQNAELEFLDRHLKAGK
jgi:acetyl esterase/lipase